MIDAVETYPELLAALMTFEPPVHVFGGFAEDALLHGRTQRPHDDVDVLVGRHELDVQVENARQIGFGPFKSRFEPLTGRPLALGATMGSSTWTPGSTTWPRRHGVVRGERRGRPSRRHLLSHGVFDASTPARWVPVRTVSPLAFTRSARASHGRVRATAS